MKEIVKEVLSNKLDSTVEAVTGEVKAQYNWAKFSVKLGVYTFLTFVITLTVGFGIIVYEVVKA